jgi:hypothetical protein
MGAQNQRRKTRTTFAGMRENLLSHGMIGIALYAAIGGSPLFAQTGKPSSVETQVIASPKAIATSGGIQVSSRHLRPGETTYVTLQLRHQGTGILRSQGPPPQTVYTQNESYTQKGLNTIDPGRYSIVMTLSGPRGREWPYRWGLGGDMQVGEIRRVTFPLRLTQPGLYTLYIGIAAGNEVRELALGQIGLEVAARGEPFQTPSGRLIGTPPPTRVTVNGKEADLDRLPLYYQKVGTGVPETYRILVPVRFVVKEMGAQVVWDAGTRTAIVQRGENHLELKAGSMQHRANGKTVTSHIPLRIVDGRTMVPLNFLTEKLGGKVRWDLRSRTLAINLPDLTVAPGSAPRI